MQICQAMRVHSVPSDGATLRQSTKCSHDLDESAFALLPFLFELDVFFCRVKNPLSNPAAFLTQFVEEDVEIWWRWCCLDADDVDSDSMGDRSRVVHPALVGDASPPQPVDVIGPAHPFSGDVLPRTRTADDLTAVTIVTSSSSTRWFSAADTSQ